MGLVFRVRQLRTRIVRVRQLLDCLTSRAPRGRWPPGCWPALCSVGRERRSLRRLIATNSSLLAAKVTERSAETGEHYITRTAGNTWEWCARPRGGGLVMAVTTLVKFGLAALALSAFWGGFWAGVNYAISFVLIQLLHFTVATKQPAMTAPGHGRQAQRHATTRCDADLEAFVDKVANLVRTQVAAILGNVLLVFPAALVLGLAHSRRCLAGPPLDAAHATQPLDALHVLGPSPLFAAFTGRAVVCPAV